MLANINRLLGASNMFEKHKDVLPGIGNGLIFTTHGYCFSLIWAKQKIYLFDPHSRNKDGSFIASGSSTLLAFKSLSNVENYIKTEYVKHIQNFNETQFDLQYVNIVTEPTSISTILSSVNKARSKGRKQIYDAKFHGSVKHEEIKKQKRDTYATIIGTSQHDQVKKQMRDRYATIIGTPEHDTRKKQKRDRYATIIGTPEHDTLKKQKRDRHLTLKLNSNSEERIFKFTKQIQEGPYYVCAVCNRCHYFRSVLLFKPEKYDIDIDQFYYEVSSVDGLLYICGTCHKKLLKSEIPAQSV